MNKMRTVGIFGCGIVLGVALTLGLGANGQPAVDTSKNIPASRLQIVSFVSGATGFFDPATGQIYVYDSALANCIMVRKITTMGAPMQRILN